MPLKIFDIFSNDTSRKYQCQFTKWSGPRHWRPLTRIDQGETVSEPHGFQKIPLIGSFFSNKNKNSAKTNIGIFICPTVVAPKLRGGLDVYTADKIRKGRRDIDERTIFTDNRDPIMHVFFRPDYRSDTLVRNYLSEVINPPDAELIKTTREKRKERRKPYRRPAPAKKEAAPHRAC